jgi:polysaccharide export outer membrane protein
MKRAVDSRELACSIAGGIMHIRNGLCRSVTCPRYRLRGTLDAGSGLSDAIRALRSAAAYAVVCWLLAVSPLVLAASVQTGAQDQPAIPAADNRLSSYVLGPDDLLEIAATEADLGTKPVRVDMSGYIRLPQIGRIRAAGLSPEQLGAEIVTRLKPLIREPEVTISIVEYRSQPVSVIGSVKNPGIHQLQGRKSLIEVLSLAGGLDANAGGAIKITRRLEWGRIPLPNAHDDAGGQFSIGEVRVKGILDARAPDDNIRILPFDVISVPRAEMVYVTGQVQKAGGFVLNERENITVLKALSLAGGLDRTASPQHARILRAVANAGDRQEIAVNLGPLLEGRDPDISMQPEDILFVPSSAPKKVALRALEAAIQLGTGIVIWRR